MCNLAKIVIECLEEIDIQHYQRQITTGTDMATVLNAENFIKMAAIGTKTLVVKNIVAQGNDIQRDVDPQDNRNDAVYLQNNFTTQSQGRYFHD